MQSGVCFNMQTAGPGGVKFRKRNRAPNGTQSAALSALIVQKIFDPPPVTSRGNTMIGCYVRVSTIGQNAASQKREITRWLQGNGIDPANVRWFIDKKSGDDLARPEFEKLQAAIFAGEIKTVIVWRLDRLSRKLRDGVNVLCDWCDRKLRIVAVSQQIDFSGAMGKMLAAVILGIGEMEQETRRERQAVGIANVLADPDLRAEKYAGRKPGTFKAKPAEARRLRRSGNTVPQIARSLGVSERSVFNYLAN